jgi:hypothetical protein
LDSLGRASLYATAQSPIAPGQGANVGSLLRQLLVVRYVLWAISDPACILACDLFAVCSGIAT